MDIFKISSSAVVTVFLCTVLKRYSSEYAVACGLLGCTVMFFFVIGGIKDIFAAMYELAATCGIDEEYVILILKITGVALLGQISAALCRDAGEGTLATGAEMCASVIIILMGMPIVKSLFSIILSVAEMIP